MASISNDPRRSDLIRNLFKERLVLSNYVAPNRTSNGVVSELISKIEYANRSNNKKGNVPLAEMEEDLKPKKNEEDEKKKTLRRKYNGNPKLLNNLLEKSVPITTNTSEALSSNFQAAKDDKENIQKKKNGKVADLRPFRMKRTLTDSTNNHSPSTWKFVTTLGGPLKKRLSEGAASLIGGGNGSIETLHKTSEALRNAKTKEKQQQREHKSAASSFFGTLIRLSSSSSLKDLVFKDESKSKQQKKENKKKVVERAQTSEAAFGRKRENESEKDDVKVDKEVADRPIFKLDIDELVDYHSKNTTIDRLRPLTVAGSTLMRSEQRAAGRRGGMSRTMSLIPTSSPLPPLYEEETMCSSTMALVNDGEGGKKRRMRRYGGSHTTSTYQGKKDAAPDASPRRHLIGFLHRTSHLSLTSELSGNASFYLIGHRRHLEESTIGSESDARVFSDEDDRGSTTTDFTSVSRQHEKMAAKKKKNRKNLRKPSRASSFSSITESSMSLDVITVTLNMDTVNFLGISIVGQTSTRGDNGIYVANIMKGGAVALDGRIEAGDMILQVNDISFENFTNDQAVDVLRDAVSRRGPIKLTVAKSFENGPQSCFTIPRNSREEPVRPIDTQAWIQHTNAMRGMPSIVEESAPTPIPGEWPHGRPQSSSTVTSNGSNGQNTVVGGNGHIRLDILTDKKKVVEVMAMPSSGLDIKNRTWLKIPIPMSFLGSDLVEWLLDHVDGLRERKDARKYASDLLKLKYIAHVVNKITFTEQCYYVLGDECAGELYKFRNEDGGPKYQWATGMNGGGMVVPPHPPIAQSVQGTQYGSKPMAPSMVSGYASMPVSPYPMPQKREDQRSQASGSSGTSARMRNIILPNKPSSSGSGGGGGGTLAEDFPDMAASRQSFRAAMNHPYEFLIDNI